MDELDRRRIRAEAHALATGRLTWSDDEDGWVGKGDDLTIALCDSCAAEPALKRAMSREPVTSCPSVRVESRPTISRAWLAQTPHRARSSRGDRLR